MKKKIRRILRVSFIVVVVTFLFTTALVSDQVAKTPTYREGNGPPRKCRFNLELKGGRSYWRLRDFDLSKTSFEKHAAEFGYGVDVKELKKSSFWGLVLSLDFDLANLHKIGLCTGFRYFPGGSYRQNLNFSSMTLFDKLDLSAYAIPLELYYKIPAGEKFFVKLSGGIEYYRMSIDNDSTFDSHIKTFFWRGKFKDSGIGGFISLGGEIFIKKTISLTFEGGYSLAKFDNFTGELLNHMGERSELLLVMAGDNYNGEVLSLHPASEPLPKGMRPVEIDLSGLRFSLGFKITLASKNIR